MDGSRDSGWYPCSKGPDTESYTMAKEQSEVGVTECPGHSGQSRKLCRDRMANTVRWLALLVEGSQ